MATGAADANGIWIYGEDDNESTHSALLNKLGNSVSTTVTRLEEMSGLTPAQLTTHRDNIGVGLVNVVPASVAQSGGSASATDLGVVTFTGVTSVSLNNVFSADYKNYKVVINFSDTTVNGSLYYRARRAGTDLSTASVYNAGSIYLNATNGSIGNISQNGAAFVSLGYLKSGNGRDTSCVIDAVDAYSTSTSKLFFQSQGATSNPYSIHAVSGTARYTPGTEHDGFTLYASAAGTFSGTVQVFGYNS